MEATLEYWQDDEWYVGRVKEIPGVFSQGKTLEELQRNIQEVYQLIMEDEFIDVQAERRQVAIAL